MILKYDSYYEKELPFKITFEEYLEHLKYKTLTNELFIAVLRNIGPDKVRFLMPSARPEDITIMPIFGMALTSVGNESVTECKLVLNKDGGDLFNPFFNDAKSHWCHSYKIKTTPTQYHGVIDQHYVCDFVSMIESKYYLLVNP